MKKIAIKVSTLLFGLMAITVSTSSLAGGQCGTGYIMHVYGGGWNQDGLIIKLDYSAGGAAPNTYNSGTLRFDPALTEKRLDMIQGIALLALANGNQVQLYSHNDNAQGQPDCSNMTQIILFRNSST